MADGQVAVVVPFAGTDPDRLAALRWVTDRYPWPVVVGRCAGEWCKAAAVADAIARTDAPLLVIADADVWCDSTWLAVEAVAYGRAAWAIPHKLVHRLSHESTAQVLDGADWRGLPLSGDNGQDRKPYRGTQGGGIVALSRRTYEACPLDPRFVGWGQEDQSWGLALRTMVGPPWRGDDDLVHLWHPAQPRKNRVVGSDAGKALARRYQAARNNRPRMAQLLAEAEAPPA